MLTVSLAQGLLDDGDRVGPFRHEIHTGNSARCISFLEILSPKIFTEEEHGQRRVRYTVAPKAIKDRLT
jgi:hypothetical protein